MKLRNPWLIGLIAMLGAWVIRGWMGTLHIRLRNLDRHPHPSDRRRQRFIYAFWHETLLVPASLGVKGDVLISRHADGELMARICRHLGLGTVRGSTTRGAGPALRELVRRSRYTHLGVTPDGPQGPRRRIQPGVVFLASRTGLPIVPVGVGFARAWRARSWDRFAVPKPWSAVCCVIGPAIHVPAKLSRQELEACRQAAEEQFLKVTALAERWAERRPCAEPPAQETSLRASA